MCLKYELGLFQSKYHRLISANRGNLRTDKKLHGHLIEPMVYLPVKSPDWYVTMKYKQHIDKYWKTNASHEIYFRLP